MGTQELGLEDFALIIFHVIRLEKKSAPPNKNGDIGRVERLVSDLSDFFLKRGGRIAVIFENFWVAEISMEIEYPVSF